MTNQEKLENENNERARVIKDRWQPPLTLLMSFLALLVSVFAVLDKAYGLTWIFSQIYQNGQFVINIFNILASLVALIAINIQKTPSYKITNLDKFKSLAEVSYQGKDLSVFASNIDSKVEILVSQFKLQVSLFTLLLIAVYLVIIFHSDNTRDINYFSIGTNIFNLLGALFVYLAFKVLHNKTVVDKEEEKAKKQGIIQTHLPVANHISTNYWLIPGAICIFYVIFFLNQAFSNIPPREVEVFLNRFDLVVGSANGLAMTLLFGRFVSIEQSLKETSLFKKVFKDFFYPFSKVSKKESDRDFSTQMVSVGITFILPIYALAQPLFGSLEVDLFGDPKSFQTSVYATCLVGKIVLFVLCYLLISKKLMQLYLYGVVSRIGNFKELEKCLE